jgi:hypothetical protein
MLKHSRSGHVEQDSMLIIDSDNSNQQNSDNEDSKNHPQITKPDHAHYNNEIVLNVGNKLPLNNNTEYESITDSFEKSEMLEVSSSKDLELFLEEERKVQQQVLDKNAFKLDELEDLFDERQRKSEEIQEYVEDSFKLNLLNVINNDRIANQKVKDEPLNEGSKTEDAYPAKGHLKMHNHGATLSTTLEDTEVIDANQSIIKKPSTYKAALSPENKNKTSGQRSIKKRKAPQKVPKTGNSEAPKPSNLLSNKRRGIVRSKLSETQVQSVSLEPKIRNSENPIQIQKSV